MDSLWSWIVCAATFFSHIVAIGFSYAISVYYVEFLAVFNESSGTTSWLSSLNYGMLCLIGGYMYLLFLLFYPQQIVPHLKWKSSCQHYLYKFDSMQSEEKILKYFLGMLS